MAEGQRTFVTLTEEELAAALAPRKNNESPVEVIDASCGVSRRRRTVS